jgi:hypothetical protein
VPRTSVYRRARSSDRRAGAGQRQDGGCLQFDLAIGGRIRRVRGSHRLRVLEEPGGAVPRDVAGGSRHVQRDRLEALDPVVREARRGDVVQCAAPVVDDREPPSLRTQRGCAFDDRDPRDLVGRRRHGQSLHCQVQRLRLARGVDCQ